MSTQTILECKLLKLEYILYFYILKIIYSILKSYLLYLCFRLTIIVLQFAAIIRYNIINMCIYLKMHSKTQKFGV